MQYICLLYSCQLSPFFPSDGTTMHCEDQGTVWSTIVFVTKNTCSFFSRSVSLEQMNIQTHQLDSPSILQTHSLHGKIIVEQSVRLSLIFVSICISTLKCIQQMVALFCFFHVLYALKMKYLFHSVIKYRIYTVRLKKYRFSLINWKCKSWYWKKRLKEVYAHNMGILTGKGLSIVFWMAAQSPSFIIHVRP